MFSGAIYDFIIVGAGSAGCVIANRLSENPNWNILLLEAGQVESLIGRIPMFVSLLYDSKYNWHYAMEQEDTVGWGMTGKRIAWSKGKGLGGSSMINYMVYSRGSYLDYDK